MLMPSLPPALKLSMMRPRAGQRNSGETPAASACAPVRGAAGAESLAWTLLVVDGSAADFFFPSAGAVIAGCGAARATFGAGLAGSCGAACALVSAGFLALTCGLASSLSATSWVLVDLACLAAGASAAATCLVFSVGAGP